MRIEAKPKYRVVEVYAGTARSAEPFKNWKRAELALLVDSNKFARYTYHLNFPNAPYVNLDLGIAPIRDVIAKAHGSIDVLLGCPPCQGFSESGKRDPDDPRNSHMKKFARLVQCARPKAVALENVPMAAASPEYRYLISTLDAEQYRWKAIIANAVQYGSCQSRQRLILVAFRRDVGVEPRFPAPTHGGNKRVFSYSSRTFRSVARHAIEVLGVAPATQRLGRDIVESPVTGIGIKPSKRVWDVIGDLPDAGTAAAVDVQHAAWSHSTLMLRRMGQVPEGGQWSGGDDHYSHSYGRLHRTGFARTITSFFAYAGGGRFWHPTQNRALTIREAARIQGFPDSFRFLEQTKRTAALVGNALDSTFSSMCYRMIRRGLE